MSDNTDTAKILANSKARESLLREENEKLKVVVDLADDLINFYKVCDKTDEEAFNHTKAHAKWYQARHKLEAE